MNILITGATGNIGLSILRSLQHFQSSLQVFAGVRNIETDTEKLKGFNIACVKFDFENIDSFSTALKGIDVLFLLRPPQLADVSKYFKPLIYEAKIANIKHIIFLSVQGAENSSLIPHHKIEKLIVESRIPYTLLRPAYFMQNFTTTLRSDIINKQRIFLPAGNAKFTVIDVNDIGAVAAKIITAPQSHFNQSYELTNNETLTFTQMAEKISKGTEKDIKFVSPSLIRFYFTKRKEQVPVMLILVMIMLHYFPRFQKTPKTTEWVKLITGQEPKSFDDFVHSNLRYL